MVQSKVNDLKMGERGAILSIFAYIFLSVLKLVIADMTNSAALKADGMNNATDIVASIAVLIGLRFSQKPADKNHPYGHWKAETIAAMVASFIMMAVGLQVLFEALTSVFAEKQESPDMIAALTAVFSAGIMYLVYRYNRNLGRKINSQAVTAAAKDNLSDAWVSIGASIGIIGSQFGLPWLDPLTAVVVGLLICKTAWGIFREASLDLTDGYDEEKLVLYKESILGISGVKGIKDIRARRYGSNSVVDVVILVNSTLGIQAAHQISDCVEEVLIKEHQIFDVHVHVEPN
ncbi:cation diffusion facilitator family transporter [Siminovitchia fordii]|uniref:Transporter YeaB n=1 Tax=Siminovitchia fordii TaxID=254759 RepID=A0ABQ4K3T7_9BACI|nr:cation diffusion facilitator family transporter [Siminovitchia fordii]GIN19670.1 putative transporter YeaB [Siminovitchia fordii]